MKVKPEITLIVHEENIPVRGNAIDSGDPEFDAAMEGGILDRLDDGDIWAWCCVEVKAAACSISESTYLGGCCYKDEEDFRSGGYFTDMVAEAVQALADRLKALQGMEIDTEVANEPVG